MDLARSETVEREGREPDRLPPAGGAAEMPDHIYRYVLATSGWHQLVLVGLTVAVFLLEVVPLELQRRIVNDLVKHREYWSIVMLAAVYAGTVLVQGGTKLVLNIYRSWVGERATRDLRRRVHLLVSSASAASSSPEAEGIQASMIVAEVESIGGFAGGSISEPLLQGGILVSVLAYMVHVDLWMAATAFALFVPQLVFVPRMQGAMNRRTRSRVQILRQLSVSVVESAAGDDAQRDQSDDQRIAQVFELNMGIYRFKFSMNFLMNLSTQLQIIGALLVGGWAVYQGRLEIGGVVAFISGIGRITDPWGDLVNYFREVNLTQVKYALVRDAIHQQAQGQMPAES
jgi:ABC-type bacteriocin/lantibiotic exporter with double-glycine peptidase domain